MNSIRSSVRRLRAPYVLRTWGLAAGAALATACATNPATGEREPALASESQEVAMGRDAAAEVARVFGLHSDSGLQTYVDGIGQRLAARTERPGLTWQFRVLEDASVNAFALPGGYIFVTRGLLTHINSEAALASVLGHEAGHVAARHSVHQMSRQRGAAFGLGIGSVVAPAITEYNQIAGAGVGFLRLKHDRDDETLADGLGFRYALADGYDTREMIGVFQMLQRNELANGGGHLPVWQATHPDPGDRISRVQNLVAASSANFATAKIGQDEFLRRLEGMVYGENPREGYFHGAQFVHPDMRFVIQFPADWARRKTNRAVMALSSAHDALLELRGAHGTPDEAARAFFTQDGAVQEGATSVRSINGNRAVSGEFSAPSGDGKTLRGVATFIAYDGATWAIVGYSAADNFSTYQAAFASATDSFDRLTNAAAIAAEPLRIRLVTTPSAMSLLQFNAQWPSSIPIAELALINGIAEGGSLRAGQTVKRVVGVPVATNGSRQ